MKKLTWCTALVLAACGGGSGLGGDDDPQLPDAYVPPIDTPPGVTVVNVPAGDIATDTTWTADKIYVLEGYVFVTSGTLTIEAGTVVGSGTVANRDAAVGCSCIAERRVRETIEGGKPVTPFMSFGDQIRIEMLDRSGKSIFGAIDQKVVRYTPPA